MIQMKEQDKTSEKEPKMEVSNLPDKEFKETPKKRTKNLIKKLAAREKQVVAYKGTPIMVSVDFSAGTLQARRELHNIFKVLTGKYLQPRIPDKVILQH